MKEPKEGKEGLPPTEWTGELEEELREMTGILNEWFTEKNIHHLLLIKGSSEDKDELRKGLYTLSVRMNRGDLLYCLLKLIEVFQMEWVVFRYLTGLFSVLIAESFSKGRDN